MQLGNAAGEKIEIILMIELFKIFEPIKVARQTAAGPSGASAYMQGTDADALLRSSH
jgi:hypothetical protein